jgi:hypothetical protein
MREETVLVETQGRFFYIGKKGIIIAYFLGDYSIYFLFKDFYARRSDESW